MWSSWRRFGFLRRTLIFTYWIFHFLKGMLMQSSLLGWLYKKETLERITFGMFKTCGKHCSPFPSKQKNVSPCPPIWIWSTKIEDNIFRMSTLKLKLHTHLYTHTQKSIMYQQETSFAIRVPVYHQFQKINWLDAWPLSAGDSQKQMLQMIYSLIKSNEVCVTLLKFHD